jgi:hypothetical protein
MGQKPALPRCNSNGRFTSVSRHEPRRSRSPASSCSWDRARHSPTRGTYPSEWNFYNSRGLFGCRRARPLDHPGGAGLLWAINGGRLVELHRDWAVIELAANGSRRVFERRRVDAARRARTSHSFQLDRRGRAPRPPSPTHRHPTAPMAPVFERLQQFLDRG